MPTVAEAGVPGYDSGAWFGLVAPANTPKDIVNKLSKETARILKLPDVRDTLTSQSTQPLATGPQETARWLTSERERWAKVVKASGAKVE